MEWQRDVNEGVGRSSTGARLLTNLCRGEGLRFDRQRYAPLQARCTGDSLISIPLLLNAMLFAHVEASVAVAGQHRPLTHLNSWYLWARTSHGGQVYNEPKKRGQPRPDIPSSLGQEPIVHRNQ